MKKLIASLQQQKQFHLKSQGLSMLPILQPNDVLYYKKTVFAQTKPNDLIMVKKNSRLFTHRVIYKDKNYLITKGDNNLESDRKIYPRQIIAKVTQVKRNGQIFNPESLYLLQSTLYFQEIVKIKEAFEREKIDFVFFKGLPLHLYYEKTHPRRIYLDCDVLIAPNDFLKAEKILFQFGYKKGKTELSSTHKKIKNKEIENTYLKVINGFSVVFDLHLEVVFMMTQLGKLNALYPQKLIDQMTNEFLKNIRTVKIQNEYFPVLSNENLILYLALHFFHHNFQGAFRLEFLDRIIRKERINNVLVNRLIETIKKYQLQNFVYPVFVLLQKYYHTPLPNKFLKSIQPVNPLTRKLVNKLIKTDIFNDEPRITAGMNRFKNLFFLSPESLWRKLLIFLNPQVLYSIFWVGKRRLSSFFSNLK